MGTWRTHRRATFDKGSNKRTLVELKSHTEHEERRYFVSIASAYETKTGEIRYKGSVTLPTKHLGKIIRALKKLEEEINDDNEEI